MGVGRYFGREPHVSQQEAEAQAKQAIEAAVSKGRPPEQEWKGLAARTADISRELATRLMSTSRRRPPGGPALTRPAGRPRSPAVP